MRTYSVNFCLLILFSIILFSCTTSRQGNFAKRKYFDFPRADHSFSRIQSKFNEQPPLIDTLSINSSQAVELSEMIFSEKEKVSYSPILIQNNQQEPQRKIDKVISAQKNIQTIITKPFIPNIEVYPADKIQRKYERRIDRLYFFAIVLFAIIFPPVGVFLYDWLSGANRKLGKKFSWAFWVTLLLLLLAIGFVPFRTTSILNLLSWAFWAVGAIIAVLYVFDIF